MKTIHVTESQIQELRQKFSMIECTILTVEIEVTPGKNVADWISVRLKVNETNKTHIICAGDYEWIMTPGKLEMHIFGVGRDIGEQHIFDHYNCTKK